MKKAPAIKPPKTQTTAANETPDSDGRRRRSQDSRARIVEAMLDLVRAGERSPAAEQVAARANVGLRTVFRQFKDMDSLYGEMSRVIEAQLQAVLEQPFRGDDWRARVLEIAARRAAVYETIGPFKRASDSSRHRSAFLEAGHRRLVATLRDILRRHLPAAVADDHARFEALDLLLSFEAWNRLREDQGLTREAAESVLAQALGRFLD
jgi:AcrR family transcriptional regulator